MNFLHVDVTVRINGEAYAYRDPQGSENISFSVPIELFDSKKIANIFPQLISVAESKYELRKAEAEMQPEEETD